MLIVQCLECKYLQNQHFKINNLNLNLNHMLNSTRGRHHKEALDSNTNTNATLYGNKEPLELDTYNGITNDGHKFQMSNI